MYNITIYETLGQLRCYSPTDKNYVQSGNTLQIKKCHIIKNKEFLCVFKTAN